MYFLRGCVRLLPGVRRRRYRPEVLGVKLRGRNISDVLQMTVDEAVDFFATRTAWRDGCRRSVRRARLSQARPGGHDAVGRRGAAAQDRRRAGRAADRRDAVHPGRADDRTPRRRQEAPGVLNRLVDAGNTVLVVEHHLDVIKSADHVVDLGPEGGEDGGEIVAEGRPRRSPRPRLVHRQVPGRGPPQAQRPERPSLSRP